MSDRAFVQPMCTCRGLILYTVGERSHVNGPVSAVGKNTCPEYHKSATDDFETLSEIINEMNRK